MSKRGWIHPIKNLKDSAEEAMRLFINDGCPNGETIEACFKENLIMLISHLTALEILPN
jgi:hypothetical protein